MINDIFSYCHSQTYVEDQDGVFLAQCHNESLVGLLTTILSQDAQHCLTPAGQDATAKRVRLCLGEMFL